MKKILALLLFCSYALYGFACTTFFLDDNGHYYFGRNYDWITGNGMVMTNVKGVRKISAVTHSDVSWISQYGSISFNQYGKEFPTGGMNEKGLVVELMWLDQTKYPEADNRPAFDVLQWIQYQLDNCASIEEVVATDKKIRINAENNTPLHYLIADATGKAATIEFLDGKMVVHKGQDLSFPVLTNSIYSQSVQRTEKAVKNAENLNFQDNSIQRFAQACSMISSFKTSGAASALDYSFSILHKVAQGDYTKWSIVYDLTEKKIHFITSKNKNRRTVSFSAFDLACPAPSLAADMNEMNAGNLTASFKKLSYEVNRSLVETSVQESRSILNIPSSAVDETAAFYNKVNCIKQD
jgi:penicillin V acylase-like amidase (Ntn superfamily)